MKRKVWSRHSLIEIAAIIAILLLVVVLLFPPVSIADDSGEPIHSWRVLILPFIDQPLLFKRYDFNEPWNGPNNSKLASEHPQLDVFHCPESPEDNFNYMAIIGENTMWSGANCVSIKDVTDGTSNTIFVVEVTGQSSHWMEPVDLKMADLPLQVNPETGLGVSSHHKGGVNVAYVDGRVLFMPTDFPGKYLPCSLLRNDECPVFD